jgi:hypothetical protein
MTFKFDLTAHGDGAKPVSRQCRKSPGHLILYHDQGYMGPWNKLMVEANPNTGRFEVRIMGVHDSKVIASGRFTPDSIVVDPPATAEGS